MCISSVILKQNLCISQMCISMQESMSNYFHLSVYVTIKQIYFTWHSYILSLCLILGNYPMLKWHAAIKKKTTNLSALCDYKSLTGEIKSFSIVQ